MCTPVFFLALSIKSDSDVFPFTVFLTSAAFNETKSSSCNTFMNSLLTRQAGLLTFLNKLGKDIAR